MDVNQVLAKLFKNDSRFDLIVEILASLAALRAKAMG